MRLIAENHITITKQLFTEGTLAARSPKYIQAVYRMAVVLVLVLILSAVLVPVLRLNPMLLAGEFIFIAALLLWLMVVLPRNGCRSRYKAMCGGASVPPSRTVLFYQDHLTVKADSGKEASFDYKNICQILDSSHMWILKTDSGAGILLKKDGFISGNMDIVKKAIDA